MTGTLIATLVVIGLFVIAAIVTVARELATDGYRRQPVRVDYDSRYPTV